MRRAGASLFLLLASLPLRADDKTITVWAMGEEGKKIAQMARKFEALNPGTRVETQAIPWDAAHSKLLVSVVGGIPPDVAQMGTTWMAEFAAMNALEPLDERARASATAQPESFFPGSLQTCYVDRTLYGLPWYVDTRVLFYRKDLLAHVGFDAAPRTWEELETAADRLTAFSGPEKKKGYGLALGARSWTDLLLFVWQNGGDPLRPSAPEFQEALRHYVGFFRRGAVPTKEAADADIFHAFKTGYLPMFISGPWMVDLIRKEIPALEGRWGVSMLPGRKSHTSFVGGCNLVVFKDSRRKELAWRFVEFMSDPANQVEWFKVVSALPSARKSWDDAVFQDKPMIQVFGRQMYDTASPPNLPEWEQIANAIDTAMEQIVLQDPALDATIPQQLLSLESAILAIRNKRSSPERSNAGFFMGFFFLLILGAGFLFFRSWGRISPSRSPERAPWSWKALKTAVRRDLPGYLFISPAVILLGLFFFFPILATFAMSLTDMNVFNINQWDKIRFVGWDNYLRTFQDPIFWRSLWNTVYFAFFGVIFTIGLSLFAAITLNQKFIRGKAVFRMALFAPVITTIVAVAVVWRWIYNPEYGVFNWILSSIGLSPLHWLSDPKTALPSLVLMAVWKNFGYNMVIFLAGLQTIPENHYEAAQIDGADPWHCFRYITLPGLTPTLLFVFILTVIGYLQFFAEPYVMTQGGPLGSTMSIVYYMYTQGFKFFDLGYASAISYVLFFIIFGITFLQLRLKKNGFEGLS